MISRRAEHATGLQKFGSRPATSYACARQVLRARRAELARLMTDEMGKPVGADLRQGTVTLPLMLALNDREVGTRLRAILDRNDLNDSDYESVVTLVRNSTAIAEAERSAQEFAREAATELAGFPPSTALTTLERVCDYVVERRI